MKRADRLEILQRQVAWHTRFVLTIVEDLQDATHEQDAGAACYLLQAFAAGCLTLTHQLWPGGRRITDQIAIASAVDLRRSLGVGAHSLLAPERIAPLGITIHFTHPDCVHFFNLERLLVEVDAEIYPLRPVIEEIRALAERASAMAGKVPVVASHNG